MEILKIKYYNSSVGAALLLVLFFAGISLSCEKDANVKLPKIESKLVVISFISPQDTLLRVSVKLSQPLYNNAEKNKYQPVKDAMVTISGNGLAVNLVYNDSLKEYTAKPNLLNVTEGIVYNISVSTPDGKQVSGSTVIPSANTSLSYTYDPVATSLLTSWTDPTSSVDYYRVMVENTSYYIYSGFNQNGEFADTIVSHGILNNELIADVDYPNSSTIVKNLTNFYGGFYSDSVYIHLLHVSKNYYEYSTKLLTAYDSGNPFQEPTIMYSNIDGGLGVFAGFNIYTKTFLP